MPVANPFVLFLIAALIVPPLWFAWWALDSAFRGTRVPEEARPAPKPAPKTNYDDYPRAVDLTLPRRRGAIVMYSLTGETECGSCVGADLAGKCPRALADGTVACAGSLLALPTPIRGSAEWQIPSGYKACPVASYDVYRHAIAVN